MSEIVCIKLASSEEIIGYVVDNLENTKAVTMKKVRTIQYQQIGNNQLGISFVPFSIANPDSEITIKLCNAATYPYAPASDIEKGFMAQTTTIALA